MRAGGLIALFIIGVLLSVDEVSVLVIGVKETLVAEG